MMEQRSGRMVGWGLVALLVMAISSFSYAASAQSAQPAPASWSIGGWLAGAKHQTQKTRMGRMHDRDLYLVAIRAAHPIVSHRLFVLDYTADFLPLLVATANREYTSVPISVGCKVGSVCLLSFAGNVSALLPSSHTAYGFGVSPLGLRGRVAVYGPLQLTLGLSGGAAYFDRKIPDPGETRFNFTADGNAGLLLRTRVGGVSAGARMHHISNGNTGRVNPAIDTRMIYVGFER